MAKEKSKALAKAKKGKQAELAGFERKRIPEIDKAAERYVQVRDARMELTKDEVKAKAALIQACVKNKVDKYLDTSVSPPLEVEVKPSELDVKVKQRKDEEGE
jgi:hypothetical protein